MSDITKETAIAASAVMTAQQVTDAWKQSELKHLQLISTNKHYRALPTQTWNDILARHQTVHPYTADFFDCDSYAVVFSAFAVWNFGINGVAQVLDSGAGHSYNAVLVSDDNGKTCTWKKVEPQADIFVDAPPKGIHVTAPKGAYAAMVGFAITV